MTYVVKHYIDIYFIFFSRPVFFIIWYFDFVNF